MKEGGNKMTLHSGQQRKSHKQVRRKGKRKMTAQKKFVGNNFNSGFGKRSRHQRRRSQIIKKKYTTVNNKGHNTNKLLTDKANIEGRHTEKLVYNKGKC